MPHKKIAEGSYALLITILTHEKKCDTHHFIITGFKQEANVLAAEKSLSNKLKIYPDSVEKSSFKILTNDEEIPEKTTLLSIVSYNQAVTAILALPKPKNTHKEKNHA